MGLIDVIESRITYWKGLCGVSHQTLLQWAVCVDVGSSGN